MQKIKLNLSGILTILKCALIGIVVSLLGTIIFAFVLKFANLSSIFISYINNFIKLVSIFVMLTCLKRNNGENFLIKSIISGVVYAMLTFTIFSILNGGFNFDMSVIYDLVFCVIVSIIVAVVINVLNRKSA